MNRLCPPFGCAALVLRPHARVTCTCSSTTSGSLQPSDRAPSPPVVGACLSGRRARSPTPGSSSTSTSTSTSTAHVHGRFESKRAEGRVDEEHEHEPKHEPKHRIAAAAEQPEEVGAIRC